MNDPLYNHEVFGPTKGRGGDIGGKTDEQLVRDLINIHNAENWLGIDGDSELSLFKPMKSDSDDGLGVLASKGKRTHYYTYIIILYSYASQNMHTCELYRVFIHIPHLWYIHFGWVDSPFFFFSHTSHSCILL